MDGLESFTVQAIEQRIIILCLKNGFSHEKDKIVSLQNPKLTFWSQVFTKVSYGSRNRRKGYYTDGAPFAK